jgi:hypothetical protein
LPLQAQGHGENYSQKEKKTLELASFLQGPDEPYQEFVACLLQNLDRTMANTKAGKILVKQLVFENINKACKTAFGHIEKEPLCRK